MQVTEKNKSELDGSGDGDGVNGNHKPGQMMYDKYNNRSEGNNTLQRIRTDNHPLMASPLTRNDSDSEYEKSIEECKRITKDAQGNSEIVNAEENDSNDNDNKEINYYPDVVPCKEHLYMSLAVDPESNNILNVNRSQQELVREDGGNGRSLERSTTIRNSIKSGTSTSSLENSNNFSSTINLKSSLGYRDSSPDVLSNDSEMNVSQYQAIVNPNYQYASLTPNRVNCTSMMVDNCTISGVRCHTTNDGSNKNPVNYVPRTMKGDDNKDIKSIDSISNHSFDGDEDLEHNLASLSPSSSLIDGLDDDKYYDDHDVDDIIDDYGNVQDPNIDTMKDNIIDIENIESRNLTNSALDGDSDLQRQRNNYLDTRNGRKNNGNKRTLNELDQNKLKRNDSTAPSHTPTSQSFLPQYTANEERRDTRSWQKVILPDGRTRDIDMRVIEPYKRVLSHGGYLKAGGHNAIVIFCACHLPDRSRTDYNYVMDNLFLYVVKTLEQLVTDDYVLIYLHGGSNRRNMPSFPWLKK